MMVARDRSTDRTNCHHADVAMHSDGVGCHVDDDDEDDDAVHDVEVAA